MRYTHVLTLGLAGMGLMACAHRTQAQATAGWSRAGWR
jgi:hypothetical protein